MPRKTPSPLCKVVVRISEMLFEGVQGIKDPKTDIDKTWGEVGLC